MFLSWYIIFFPKIYLIVDLHRRLKTSCIHVCVSYNQHPIIEKNGWQSESNPGLQASRNKRSPNVAIKVTLIALLHNYMLPRKLGEGGTRSICNEPRVILVWWHWVTNVTRLSQRTNLGRTLDRAQCPDVDSQSLKMSP